MIRKANNNRAAMITGQRRNFPNLLRGDLIFAIASPLLYFGTEELIWRWEEIKTCIIDICRSLDTNKGRDFLEVLCHSGVSIL
jgi:hypothetical protein